MTYTLQCPTPLAASERILLGHGSGGRLSAQLLRDIVLPPISNPLLDRMEDQAALEIGGRRIAFTTDSFVVNPRFFPGGDIGSLAVHGTVNDLAVGGAHPLFLSASLILEEGFSVTELRRIMESMGRAALASGVPIVTGDTKVVEKGSGDGIFINTSGLGLIHPDFDLGQEKIRPGDFILASGFLGDHGIAILSQREDIGFDTGVVSDSAALDHLVAALLPFASSVHAMRDPTRGGLSAALHEIAQRTHLGMAVTEADIPIRESVRAACEFLGLDPLHVANEGKLILFAAPEGAEDILYAMRSHPLGREAACIGRVVEAHAGTVTLRTPFGGTRILDPLSGDQLPRIC